MVKPLDLSEMTLDRVRETNDVLFGDLSKADRMLLYLVYTRSKTRSMSMIEETGLLSRRSFL